MVDHGLNLDQAGLARLRSRSRRDRDFALVPRYRKPIVIASLICGDLAAALAAGLCIYLLAQLTGQPSPEPHPATALLIVLAFFVVGLYSGAGPGPYERF